VLNYLSTTPWKCMGEWRYSFTVLDLDTSWMWVVSFTPWERDPGTQWRGGRVDTRFGLDSVEKQVLHPDRPVRSPWHPVDLVWHFESDPHNLLKRRWQWVAHYITTVLDISSDIRPFKQQPRLRAYSTTQYWYKQSRMTVSLCSVKRGLNTAGNVPTIGVSTRQTALQMWKGALSFYYEWETP
jgi:hypothetical protein